MSAPLIRQPATAALLALARLCPPTDALPDSRWQVSSAVPLDELWLSKDWLGWCVWAAPELGWGDDVEPGKLAWALARGRGLATWPLLTRELMKLREIVLAVGEQEGPCPVCTYRPHVDTCPVVRLRAGAWLTGA